MVRWRGEGRQLVPRGGEQEESAGADLQAAAPVPGHTHEETIQRLHPSTSGGTRQDTHMADAYMPLQLLFLHP
jgi:hypothetical protein